MYHPVLILRLWHPRLCRVLPFQVDKHFNIRPGESQDPSQCSGIIYRLNFCALARTRDGRAVYTGPRASKHMSHIFKLVRDIAPLVDGAKKKLDFSLGATAPPQAPQGGGSAAAARRQDRSRLQASRSLRLIRFHTIAPTYCCTGNTIFDRITNDRGL